ncbi:MAG: hypothetical protein QNJ23_08675 [Woeseiaceae bacterium]|nr:hypothetical protein [Woeseiaceae bacterium]
MDNKGRLLLTAMIALSGSAWSGDTARLTIEAAPARATIQPLPEGRRLVRLPALEYEFGIHADCGTDAEATSVSISVADTRATLAGDQLRPEDPIAAVIRLPARQLAPVAIDDFCREAPDDAGENQLLVSDAATAQISLRCADATGESITYASRSLDVTLECAAPADAQGTESAATDR